jgi:hypothetical protein
VSQPSPDLFFQIFLVKQWSCLMRYWKIISGIQCWFSTNWVTSLATAYITLFYIRIGRPLYPFNRSVFTYIPIFKLASGSSGFKFTISLLVLFLSSG